MIALLHGDGSDWPNLALATLAASCYPGGPCGEGCESLLSWAPSEAEALAAVRGWLNDHHQTKVRRRVDLDEHHHRGQGAAARGLARGRAPVKERARGGRSPDVAFTTSAGDSEAFGPEPASWGWMYK